MKEQPSLEGCFLRLAAVLVLLFVLILVLVIVLVIVLVAVLLVILVLVAVLISVLVIHRHFLRFSKLRGHTAKLACPVFQLLSLALNRRLAMSPAMMAVVIPPAVAFRPPVKIPRKPSWVTASFTPRAML